jgi:AraC-like DNA-binding protein
MPIYLLNQNRVPIHFREEPALGPAYPALRGSRSRVFQDQIVRIQIKELLGELFAVRFKSFCLTRQQAIETESVKPGLHSTIMLQSALNYNIEEIGPMSQQPESVSLVWGHKLRCHAILEPGVNYQSLNIYAAPALIQQLESFFPELSSQLHVNAARLLLPNPCYVTPSLKKIISDILDCHYDVATSRFYFDLKVREYFYVLFEEYIRPRKSRYRFTPYEVDQIQRAREILLSDLARPPHTIRNLAREVALNEFKLKAGFRYLFNTGVFECFQQARMYWARHLLLHTNKPMKEISSLAGYSRTSTFITGFRKKFGYTPGSLRRTD